MEKKLWLNILKIIGCILVLINHTILLKIGDSNVDVFFACILFAISKVAVPIFVMVTASIMINRSVDFKYVLKKILKVCILLIVLSVIVYIIRNASFNLLDFIQCFFKVSIMYPYWYLCMLIGLYLMLPVLNKMIKNLNLNDFRYIVILCLIIQTIIYTLEKILNFDIEYSFTSFLLPVLISYYISGVYLSKIELTEKNRNIAFLCFIIPIIVFVVQLFMPYLNSGKISLDLDSYVYITTSLPALSLFYIIRYYFENKKVSLKLKNIINGLSSLTFGVYLFHPIIIELRMFQFILDSSMVSSIFCIFMFQILIFIVCLLFTYILKKIPIIRKIL